MTRTEYDGSITVIADRFQGKRLNSPNDVVVASDGAIWFTDPPFGLGSFYEGTIAEPELNANIYRVRSADLGEAASRPTTSWGRTDCVSRPTRSVSTSS